jgi:hypothetical protein
MGRASARRYGRASSDALGIAATVYVERYAPLALDK